MADLTFTPADIAPVRTNYADESPVIALEALTRGQYVRLDGTTGKYAIGNATTSGEVGKRGGIALNTAVAGAPFTVMHRGIIDVGTALTAMSYGDIVYLSDTDGTLGTTAGTVSTIIGYVVPGYAESTPSKLLYVAL